MATFLRTALVFGIAAGTLLATRSAPGTKILWGVPLYTQTTSYTCGPASLQMALGFFGIEMTEKEIMGLVGTTPENGTEMEPMTELANKKGLRATLRMNLTIDELRAAVETDRAVIVGFQAWRSKTKSPKGYLDDWEDGHYAVVIGVGRRTVYFADPSLSDNDRGEIPIPEFLDRWHDLSIKKEKMIHPGIILEGVPNPTASWKPVE